MEMGNDQSQPGRTPRPLRISSPSRATLSRTSGVTETRPGYDQAEPRLHSRQSHSSSSRNRRIPESRLHYDQGEPHQSFRFSRDSSSRIPRDNGTRLDYNQAAPHHSSRPSNDSSITTPGVPGSRLDYYQGDLTQARPRVDSHRSSHISRIPSTGEREISQSIGSRADNGIRSSAESDGNSRTRKRGISQLTQSRSDYDDVENQSSTRRTSDLDLVEGYENNAIDFPHPRRHAGSEMARETGLSTRRTSDSGAPLPSDGRLLFFEPEAFARGIHVPLRSAGTRAARRANDPESTGNHIRFLEPSYPLGPEVFRSHPRRYDLEEYASEAELFDRAAPEEAPPTRLVPTSLTSALGAAFANIFDADFTPEELGNFFDQDEPSDELDPELSSRVESFIARFPQVDPTTFAEEEQSCPICSSRYSVPTTATRSEDPDTEPAIRPPCHHVIGRNCLGNWLKRGKSTCPICRARLLPGNLRT
ncbi:hypothetical protein MMC07_001880 [Pseudocyphellaria aurata]|nr:hypothetical protein [Pseudocyphellaria aurata]